VTHRKSKISFVRHFHHWHSNWISNVFWSNEWVLHGWSTESTEQELPWLCQSQKMDALKIKKFKIFYGRNCWWNMKFYRHRKSRLPIEYGADGFTTVRCSKIDFHFVGCCGDYVRNCVAGCKRHNSRSTINLTSRTNVRSLHHPTLKCFDFFALQKQSLCQSPNWM
jgi:hypothetical protein